MADRPRRLHLLVEGQTEETIVRDVLVSYLHERDYGVTSSILITSRPAGQSWNRGGVSSWRRIEGDLRRLLGDTSLHVLTTLLDYYGLPADTPGMSDRPIGTPVERVRHVEQAMTDAIGDRRFVPHLVLHETEAWVFAAAEQLAELRGDASLRAVLQAEVVAAGGAEQINDGPLSAPSKRLERLCPGYDETFEGPLVIGDLGASRSWHRREPRPGEDVHSRCVAPSHVLQGILSPQ